MNSYILTHINKACDAQTANKKTDKCKGTRCTLIKTFHNIILFHLNVHSKTVL